ncbi:M16 family metallopeptidase [Chryseolinea lacunae]|uniref:Insulinase family protein n=1 Tax=Chryseolinea lacunae TaxID=2801331 RepID=A0ABS1KZ62_9BACT|nr:M16 family metallopeptidase [Chryseolinea lacunae]MBL0744753.1 insulinase family protein [Chryseolinea lacunae]
MKPFLLVIVVVATFLTCCQPEKTYTVATAESGGYTYSYVSNDPLKVRIYTLKNGLKVYLSQYTDEPRIQTQIAVKAGGKNDPATNTGLAHYLEHIMFKGSPDFGTLDWAKESVYLDSIEHMFAHYGTLTDAEARKNYYAQIDHVSNEASKFAIPNEYDKMVSEIGANYTNAYTSEDRTVYINDIPSNQVNNWLQIEGNRFRTIVPRLFHTELEAVYEEKNRGLDNDYNKTYEALYAGLYPQHPYGTQTVIGTIDHLKNPSITAIKKYFDTYYRPNNVAICMSGDLDYDKTIAAIDKYFGDWKPNEQLPEWKPTPATALTAPVVKDVYGPEAEWVTLGFRFNGRNSGDYRMLSLINLILSNDQAGLIDVNLKQAQKVLDPGSYVDFSNDYSAHTFTARPREGQTLEQVKSLLLEQIEMLKKGEFDDWLIDASINNLKKQKVQGSENNYSRSNDLVVAFTNNIAWEDYTAEIDELKKITKEDVVKFAQEHYGNNYVVVLKHTGKDANEVKVEKPAITKVTLNKENKSPFHETLLKNPVDKLKPRFVDFDKDVQKGKMNKDLEVLSTPNTENDLFTLTFLSDVGTNNDPRMDVAVDYLQYLGTSKMPVAELKKELYKLGCSLGVEAAEDETYVYLEGLSENMEKALKLFEDLLADAQPDEEALKKLIDGKLKEREDQKKDKSAILFGGLMNYGLYGAKSPFTNVLSNKALGELKADELVDIIHNFTKMQHRVLYYGPRNQTELIAVLNADHKLPDALKPTPPPVKFEMPEVKNPTVYWADYDMVQEEIMFLSKGGVFDAKRIPITRMFDEYLGGNMSSPIFQELREAQGLAYSAFAYYGTADRKEDNDLFYAYIGTQADKQSEAMKAMKGLLVDFPRVESNFDVARNAILSRIESERITKGRILFTYERARKRGIDYDIRRDVYEQVQHFTLDDIAKFQEQQIKGKPFNVVVIGDKKKIDFKALSTHGKVQELTLDQIFGYEKVEKINVEGPHQ